MRKRTFIVLILAICIVTKINAQILPFDNYSIKDGLPSNWITTIFQDSRGYIWIGGDGGLAVYDGIEFRTYSVDDGLPVGHVWSIHESRKSPGTMYIGTHGGGLSILKDGKIKSLKLSPISRGNVVVEIAEDNEGVVWCGTPGGLYSIDGDSVSYFPIENDTTNVAILHETHYGDILIATLKQGGLYKYSLSDKKMTRLDLSGLSFVFLSLLEDDDATIWLGTDDGLICKLRNDRVVAKQQTPFAHLRSVLDDREGNLWFTTSKGLVKISKSHFPNSKIVHYTSENGLLDSDVNPSLIDRENNLWFGSGTKGLFKLSDRNVYGFPLHFLRSARFNHAAVFDPHDHLFAASDEGLSEIWKSTDGIWRHHIHLLDSEIYTNIAHSVDLAADTTLWVSRENGRITGYKISPIPGKPSNLELTHVLQPGIDIMKGSPIGMQIDRDSQLWATLWQVGLIQVDLNQNKQHRFFAVEKELAGGTPQSLMKDKQGNLWVGTFSGGLYLLQEQAGEYHVIRHFTKEDGLAANDIRSIIQRHNGEIWIGTRFDGISVYRNGNFEHISTKDGLLNNAIWAMVEDMDGRVWIGTSVGVQYTDPNDPRQFLTHKRLIGQSIGSIGVAPNDRIFWSTSPDGLTIYDYGRKSLESAPPPVYITQFRVNGEETAIKSGSEFAYDENLCVFSYTGISFKSGRSVLYKYRLVGLDDRWQAPTEQRIVTYGSLPPGAYTFEVIAINADGVESTEPASLHFTILPPIWQRWWFIATGIVILTIALYAAHRIKVRRVLEIEKIRSRIATDLHDDIGAGLTHIGLLSEVAIRKAGMQKEGQNSKSRTNNTVGELNAAMQRVGSIARELSSDMSDVVWSINPNHDSVEALQHRLTAFAHEICKAKNIELKLDISDHIANRRLNPEVRRNLLMIAKEALHNAVKYSDCKALTLEIKSDGNEIIVAVEDYGDGFDANGTAKGNGLVNMRGRAEKLGGECKVVSEIGKGTRVAARVPY